MSLALLAGACPNFSGENFDQGFAIGGVDGFAREQKQAADFYFGAQRRHLLRIECGLAESALSSLDGLVAQGFAEKLGMAGRRGNSGRSPPGHTRCV